MYELPIFPLHTVLFPGMPLQLHVFEERYQLMMQHVLAGSATFGVCLIKTGLEAQGPLPLPYPTGCTARILHVDPLGKGRMNLTVIGDERFRILRTHNNQPYLTGFVEVAPLAAHHTLALVRAMPVLRQQLDSYLRLLGQYTARAQSEGQNTDDLEMDLGEMQYPEDPLALIHLAAALLQVAPLDKQPLLEADSAEGLLKGILHLLRRESAVLPALIRAPQGGNPLHN